MRSVFTTFSISLVLVLCTPAFASASGLTSTSACGHLKAAVAHKESPPHDPNEYRCELEPREGQGRYFVFALRSNYSAPPGAGPDWVGSSLVGWFAVSRSTATVFNWDVGDEVLGHKL